jgi:predicted amidohydrolase
MRVAAVQTTAGPDRDENLAAATVLVDEAVGDGARLVVLPELFSVAGSPDHLRTHAEPRRGPTARWAAASAARHGILLLAGSFPERSESEDVVYNTSILFDPEGEQIAVYRKMHLFDVRLDDTEVRESATFTPGRDLCVARLGPGVTLGLSTCYDVRFPELARILTLRGATVLAVPSAFTAATGPAHWELLLRARAVENQVYVVAAGQHGRLPPGMPACHGHSMIVDPWGEIVAERHEPGPGVVVADLDAARLDRVRAELPVLAHRRPDAYVWPDVGGDRRRAGVANRSRGAGRGAGRRAERDRT